MQRSSGALGRSTHGAFEFGGFYGTPPFTIGGSGLMGVFFQGRVGVDLAGVPLVVQTDLGTDAPARGQRNRVQVSLDATALTSRYKKESGQELDGVRDELARLRTQRAEQYRQLLTAIYRKQHSGLDSLPASNAPALPSSPVPADLSDTTLTGFPGGPVPALPGAQPPDLGVPVTGVDTSPSIDPEQARAELDATDNRIAELEQTEQRLSALQQGTKDRKAAPKFLQGMRGFSIGTCSPAHSEYLIKGLSLIGLSSEYAMRDLYLAVDAGRSFDDAWRDRTRTEGAIRHLQEVLLFQDAQDLNPRRLFAIKGGGGLPENTHLHVGYMRGRRDAMPVGLLSESLTGEEVNHVVELDGALAIHKNHRLRGFLARALHRTRDGDDGVTEQGMNGLLDRKSNDNQALLLQWTSRFEKSGTLVSLTGQLIDRHFHSMGVAFLRPGSRSGEAAVDQRLGTRLTVRSSARWEERAAAGASGANILIERYRGQVVYRPTSSLTLRAMVAPMTMRTDLEGGAALVQHNLTAQGGADWRKRIGHGRLGVHVDATRFAWAGADSTGATGAAWNISLSSSFSASSGLSADAGLNTLIGTDTLPIMTSWSAGLQWPVSDRMLVDLRAAGDIDLSAWPSCQGSLRRTIAKRWFAQASVSYLNGPELFFADQYQNSSVDNYHCRLSVGYSW